MEVLENILFTHRNNIHNRICSLVENTCDQMIIETMLDQEFHMLLYTLVNVKVYVPTELRNVKWQPLEK